MKKTAKFAGIFGSLGALALALPGQVHATLLDELNPLAAKDISSLIKTAVNTAILLAAVVAVVFLIYNGFMYMTSAGDSNKTETAQKGLANALIGLVICVAAALIVQFILSKLGVDSSGTL